MLSSNYEKSRHVAVSSFNVIYYYLYNYIAF